MELAKENRLGTVKIPKLLFQMSFPLVCSNVIQALYNVVDGIFVAKISKDALTATTLAFPAQMLMISVAGGTAVGVNSLLSRSLGARRFDDANDVARHGLFLALVSYLVFALAGLLGAEWFIGLFSDKASLLEMGSQYLLICYVGGIGVFCSFMTERLLQSTGKTSLCMVAQLIGACTNIVLDPIMIFGWLGLPAMGIRGAAIATVIGQCLAAISAYLMNLKYNHDIRISFRKFRLRGALLREIYKVGVPSMLMQSIGSIMNIGMNKILILASESAVSVFGVYYKLQSFVFLPVIGVTQGLIPIVGYNYGARRPSRIRQAIRLAVIVGFSIMALGTVLFQILPDKFLAMFSADAEMYSMGIPALRIISVTFMLSAISIVLGDSLVGIGIGTISMINSFLRQLIVLLPCAYLLQRFFDVSNVWYAFILAEVASLTFSVTMFARIYRKRIVPMFDGEQPVPAEE